MSRPKKTPISPEQDAGIESFKSIYEYPLPAQVDLLQGTVSALLHRIKHMDKEAAQQVAVFVQVLAARAVYWENRALSGRADIHRAWQDYRELLTEIALGKKTKNTHCVETIVPQGGLLDRYLEAHPEFSQCRNAVTRFAWITEHGPAIQDLLKPIPCFCFYAADLIPSTPDPWLKRVLKSQPTAAKMRDALLGLLHGTTHAQIASVRKQPASFPSDPYLFRTPDMYLFPPDFRAE